MPDVKTAGYSGTPLVKKLGIKTGCCVAIVNEPTKFRKLLVDVPDGVIFQDHVRDRPDIVIAFHYRCVDLKAQIAKLERAVFPDRVIWLAWPKKSSGLLTDLTGDIVRAAVLATRLVDIKVCAISDTWSGLKVVWRKEHR